MISRNDRYLITQRRSTAVLPGLWEFPGGRVEDGETDAQALRREVQERVGVDVEVGACIGRRTHDYVAAEATARKLMALDPKNMSAPRELAHFDF